MTHLMKFIVTTLFLSQTVMGTEPFPDIKPTIADFGPGGGWNREELEIFMQDEYSYQCNATIALSEFVHAEYGFVYPNIAEELHGKKIITKYRTITGISEKQIDIENDSDTYWQMNHPLKSLEIRYRSGSKLSMHFNSLGLHSGYTVTSFDENDIMPEYHSEILYNNRNPVLLTDNDSVASYIRARYLSSGKIDSIVSDTSLEVFQYNDDLSLARVENYRWRDDHYWMKSYLAYEWELLEDGRVNQIIQLIENGDLYITEEIHLNADGFCTYSHWAGQAGFSDSVEYSTVNKVIKRVETGATTGGNGNTTYTYTYNSDGDVIEEYEVHLYKSQKSSIYDTTRVSSTTFFYNADRWPERIITTKNERDVISIDTIDISYSDITSVTTTTTKKNRSLSLIAQNRSLNFSRALPAGSSLSLFSLNGRKILNQAVNGSALHLSESLSAGLYLWEIKEGAAVNSGQIIIR